jgi:hypothetical protein
MAYIYEMDVTRLKISYILPVGWYVRYIQTELSNDKPFDESNMVMKYSCYLCHKDLTGENYITHSEVFTQDSLYLLIEKVRKWVVRYKQAHVEKWDKDGTDSVTLL